MSLQLAQEGITICIITFRELKRLRKVVTKISNRGRIARFLLHDADIEILIACTASIKVVYDKIGVWSFLIPKLILILLTVHDRLNSPWTIVVLLHGSRIN